MPSSPLAISNIVLSQCEADHATTDSTPKVSFYRDALQPNPVPVLLRVRRVRIVLVSVVLTTAVAGVVVGLNRGLTLRTIVDTNEIATPSQRNALIQNHNAYVGMVAALCIKPLQVLTALVLPVWLWCFLTKTAMAAEARSSSKTKAALSGLSLVLLWLLSNSTHGLNVQLEYSRHYIQSQTSGLSIYGTDLDLGAGQNIFTMESILRSAVTMDYRSARSTCTRASPQRIVATVNYGFPSRAWMKSVGADAGAHQSIALTSQLNAPLPMESRASRSLAAYAFPMMEQFLLSTGEKALIKSNNMTSVVDGLWSVGEMMAENRVFNTGADLWRGINASLHKLTAAPASTRLQWFDVDNTNTTVASTNLSSGFVFESVTLDVPFLASYMQRRLTLVENDTTSSVSYNNSQPASFSSGKDYYFDINIKEECGERACIVSPRGEKVSDAAADRGAQIHALPICTGSDGQEDIGATLQLNASACAKISTNSFLVLSLAQRVDGESFNQASTNVIRLKNARKVYSVTVGRLRWSPQDLAASVGVSCANSAECTGASLRLNENEVLAANQKALALSELLMASSPVSLVSTTAQEIDSDSNLKGDIILPAQFATRTPMDVNPALCEVERGNLLASIEQNHWYSVSSEDQASTTALFWLFQDGIVQQGSIEDSSTPTSSSNTGAMASGSSSGVARLVVKLPQLSAILTYSGCAIVLLLSVAILLFSKRHESRIEKHFTPFHLAQNLVDASSPLVPSSFLLHSDLLNLGGDLLRSSEPLHEFDIVSMTLRHRYSPGLLIQVPKPPSLSASSSSMLSQV